MSDCYEYVRTTYSVPAYRGMAVLVGTQLGTRRGILVKGANLHYVYIRLDGDRRAGKYHPKDERITYFNPVRTEATLKYQLLYPDAQAPIRGSEESVSYDTFVHSVERRANGLIYVKMGIALQPPQGDWILMASRSGIDKYGLMLTNGIGEIDPDYTGELTARFIPVQASGRTTTPTLPLPQVGDRLVQITQIEHRLSPLERVDALRPTKRGEGSFGSTGR